MTLSKLSWRNAQRQARDYLVYFVTVVMAAALIYAFNGLVFSQEIAALSTQMRNLPLMIVLASLAVVAVVGWLVSYTTGFMLTRRSRELGTYLLIGLEPGCSSWKTWRWGPWPWLWAWWRGTCSTRCCGPWCWPCSG